MNTPNPAPSAPGISTEVRRTFKVEGNIAGISAKILALISRELKGDAGRIVVQGDVVTLTFSNIASASDATEFLRYHQFDDGVGLTLDPPVQ